MRRAVPPRVLANRENREMRTGGTTLAVGGVGGLRWLRAGLSRCKTGEKEKNIACFEERRLLPSVLSHRSDEHDRDDHQRGRGYSLIGLITWKQATLIHPTQSPAR